MKTITHPSGKTFKLGRLRPPAAVLARPRLRLADYMLAPLPAAPRGPYGRVARLGSVVDQVYGNDDCGDCTIAGKLHLIGAFTGLANPPAVTFTDAESVADYSRLSGYILGDDATDTGLDEITVLQDWQHGGGLAAAHPIEGFVTIDAGNLEHVKFAIWGLGNAYLGLELPDAWINPMPAASGFLWDTAGPSDPDNGHCIVAIDQDDCGIEVLTWGMAGTMTWAAVQKYLASADGGEFHAVLTREWIAHASNLAPSQIDWAGLSDDMKALSE